MPEDHLHLATSLVYLGRSLIAVNRETEAEPYLREGLSIRQKVFSATHPMTAEAEYQLGICLMGPDRFQEAESHLLNAHAIYNSREEAADKMEEVIRSLILLYERWDRPEKAESYGK